jgi:excisionase family DNA binding protein
MNEVLTTGQVAKLCNVTIRTVIKWFENGYLEGYRIPGSRDRRFERAKVIEFMRKHSIPLGALDQQLSPRRRILIVDDDDALRTVLEEYFQGLGLFDVQVARNGYEAGLKTHAFRPHLIMLDHNLGDITGAEVAASIRANPELKDTRILVMSGYLSDTEAKEVLGHGVDDFLRKPFEMERARDKVFGLLRIA